jgi:hypothetical protein
MDRPLYSDAFYALRSRGRSSRSPTPPTSPGSFTLSVLSRSPSPPRSSPPASPRWYPLFCPEPEIPMFQPAPILLAPPMLPPAPIDGPILDVPAILERSPSPLELERPPAPLLARRSSPVERGAAVMNRPEPSPVVSLQVTYLLLWSPASAPLSLPWPSTSWPWLTPTLLVHSSTSIYPRLLDHHRSLAPDCYAPEPQPTAFPPTTPRAPALRHHLERHSMVLR